MQRLLRVGAGAGLVGVAGLWLLATPVAADGGPHAVDSGSVFTPASCADCHRAPTAPGEVLLVAPDEVTLCLTCHGSTGLGATTNVLDGVEAGTTRGLRGGGFSNAIMDTGWTGAAVSRPVTSAHSYDGTTHGTTWGDGAIGSGAGTASATLTCTDCHNPHGSGAYRILRPIPTGSGAGAGVTVPDQANPVYTVSSDLNRYFGEQYADDTYRTLYALDRWCAQCHTRHEATNAGAATASTGDPVFTFRHTTRVQTGTRDCTICHATPTSLDAYNPFGVIGPATAHEPICQNCHVAHGTAAQMGQFSGLVAWPNGATSPSGNARSSLLRLDNRGLCAACHDPTK